MIAVLGTVFMDIKGYPEGDYSPTGRNAGQIKFVHGGVGRNIAEDMVHSGVQPLFISLVDDNSNGDAIINHLQREGVSTEFVLKTPNGMGTWMAIFNSDGDLAGSISKRMDMSPLEGLLDARGDEIFSACDSIALELDMDLEVAQKVFALAKKHNKDVYVVISNMACALEMKEYFKDIKCFVCNLEESGILFGKEITQAETLLALLLAEDMHSMVVTMGGDGAIYADADQGICGHVPAEKVNVVDTTGAGDAFFAGVCSGLTYGKSMEDACKLGTKLAAAAISTSGNVCPKLDV